MRIVGLSCTDACLAVCGADFNRARMLTSIHARPDKRAQQPMGNATNTPAAAGEGAGGEDGVGAAGQPPAKKLDRKKSLKRL